MKLLFCHRCNDLFNLRNEEKTCKCGLCKGRYTDALYAITNGEGLCLAIANPDISNALTRTMMENRITAVKCWARPHEGKENPHSIVEKEEK